MNDNTILKEDEFDNPLIQKIDSIIDNCIRYCHNKYFRTFDQIGVYDINFTNIANKEIVNFTIAEKSMGLFELGKKLTIARQNGFKFNQINFFEIKIYSILSHINIHYYLKLRFPIMHRHFFRKLAENPEIIQFFCNDKRKPFHFACRQWYSYNNPQ